MITFKPDPLSLGDTQPNTASSNIKNWCSRKCNFIFIALLFLFISYSGQTYAQVCACTNVGAEKVNNPHFSNTCALPTLNSATNYSSDFLPKNCNTYPPTHLHFTEGPNASYIGNWGCPTSEHTGDGVGMLIFDGPITADGDQRAWYQTGVSVTAGTYYKFSAWVANICNGCSANHYPSFKIQVVDGSGTTTLASVNLLAPCSWRQLCGVYHATTTQNVTIQVLVPAPTTYTDDSGDDGAIDDISFTSITPPDAGFVFSTPQCNVAVNFTSNNGGLTHSWSFGDPGSGANNTSTLANPSHLFSTSGTFVVTHTITDPNCGSSTSTQNVTVSAGCCCTNLGTELVNNPHFSNACALPVLNPITNYGSDLHPMACNTAPTMPDNFTEGPNASFLGSWNCPTNEHTGDGIGMMVFDGPQNGDPDKRVWFQTNVPVTYGTCYQFSAWVANICNGCTPGSYPSFKLQVVDASGNVTTVATVNLLAPCNWTKLCGVYCPCTTGNVTIQILVPAPTYAGSSGDDGAIDDISFKAQLGSDAIFTYTTPVCNGPVQFTADDQNASDTHTWNFGDNSGPDANVNPQHQFPSAGVYTVTLTVAGACGPGTSTQIVTVTGCICNLCPGTNLVTNGNFAIPCSGFYSSDLVPIPCPNGATNHDQYTETNDASIIRPNYCGRDHDGGGTNFLLADGPINGESEKRIWYENGPGGSHAGFMINPGQTYCFSAEIINVDNFDPESPSIKLVIKAGGQTFTVAEIDNLNSNECCGWTRISGCWTPPQGIMIVDELDVVMKPLGCGPGNDVGVDDIQFGESCGGTCQSLCSQGFAPMPNGKKQNPAMNIFASPNATDAVSAKVKNDLEVNPIPVVRGSNLNLKYSSANETKVKITVFDPQGKNVYQSNESLIVGENQLIVKTNNFKPGTYILKTETNNEVKSTTIIVQ